MVSEEKRRLPGVENAQSLESFCRAYLDFQDSLKTEAESLEAEAVKKLAELNAERERADSLPEQLRRREEEIRQKEKERDALREKLAEPEEPDEETEALILEEEEKCSRLCGEYERRLKELEEERRSREEMREQSAEFVQILEKNQATAKKAESYRGLAAHHVAEICRCFPLQESRIAQWVSRSVEEVLYDFEDVLPPERNMEDAIVYRPIEISKIPDYLISPDTFPYRFQKPAELMGIRILIVLILLAGVIGTFLVTPFLIPAAVVLSLLPCIQVRKKSLHYIEEQIPWEELNVCRFILNFSVGEAESMARRLCDLPDQSSGEYEEEYLLRISQMKEREQKLRLAIPGCQEAFEKEKKEYEKLAAELSAVQEKGMKPNSRLGHAIQKQKNHLELTANEKMLLQNYGAELNGMKSRLENQKQKTGKAALLLKQTKEEQLQLTAKIREEEQTFQEKHTRLTQIETVLSSEDAEQDFNDKKRRLKAERDQELERIHIEYEMYRVRRAGEVQKKQKAMRMQLEQKLAHMEEGLVKLRQGLQKLELENDGNEQRLAQLKKEYQVAGRRAGKKREEANIMFTPEVWQNNCRLWVKASASLFGKPTGEYTVKDSAWIMGPDRPYRLEHGLGPCVLLYDRDDGADAENRPAYYLEKTIKALMFGLEKSNAPGLVDFALVDESGNGGKAGESVKRCYGSQNLDRLNAFLDHQIDKIHQDERGDTVSSINEGRAMYFMENKLVSPEELQNNLFRTLFVFVLPRIRAQERPLNNQNLWQKLQEDCGRFGFVPLFLIPKTDWEKALSGGNGGSAFASAIKEGLNMFSHVRKAEIPLN